MARLDGRVAVVTEADGDDGRAIALSLAARGVRVVVAGRVERALGEVVGEIAFGGGKARHVVGDTASAIARAREVFGGLDLAVMRGRTAEEAETMPEPRRLVALAIDAAEDASALGERVARACAAEPLEPFTVVLVARA